MALQRVWMVFVMVAGAVFVSAVAFAYSAETIVSWNTVYVPINLWLNALVGGPILAIAGLRAARYLPVEARYGRVLVGISAVAFVANVIGLVLQGAELPLIQNAFGAASDLVPYYGIMVVAFALLVLIGIGLDAWVLFGERKGLGGLCAVRIILASGLVLSGIFVMRFAFYMMHMTVGLGI
ncbi:MAG: DmsC/YnfH family molybdoenzyme membrane anchor subunit [Gordonibacter sp.]|nr:DmsC/YnfH family molybdoenzyme membrane anchor subunit [Gordonibacter sp.]